jgi:hypothetical protein
MRHAYGNTYIHSDVNANGDAGCVGYANVDSHSDSYTYSDGYSWHTVTHADLRTRGHTRAMGYCSARATRSLSRWWMHRWNEYLRLRRW